MIGRWDASRVARDTTAVFWGVQSWEEEGAASAACEPEFWLTNDKKGRLKLVVSCYSGELACYGRFRVLPLWLRSQPFPKYHARLT